jgi:hypothetical protein
LPPSVERSITLEFTTRHRLSGFDEEIDSLVATDSFSANRCSCAASGAVAVPASESEAARRDANGAAGGSEGAADGAAAAGGFIASLAGR